MDASLTYREISPELGYFDLSLSGPDLANEDGLQTAVTVSLFTDRRANPDDILPDSSDDRRGDWEDSYSAIEGDLKGSRLWLLSREKQTADVVNRAVEYAEEALQWLLDDGIAASVDVKGVVPKRGVLGLVIDLERPDGSINNFQYANIWQAMNKGGLNAL